VVLRSGGRGTIGRRAVSEWWRGCLGSEERLSKLGCACGTSGRLFGRYGGVARRILCL